MRRSVLTVPVVTVLMVVATIAGTSGALVQAAPKPKAGGTLTLAFNREVAGFDTVQSTGATQNAFGDAHQFQAIYDVLNYEDPATGDVQNRIAESFTSSDGVVWTLTIRPNVRFTDGTPYDAAAVKFNWERIGDPVNRSNVAAAEQTIASMDVTGPLILKITLKAPNRSLLTISSAPATAATDKAKPAIVDAQTEMLSSSTRNQMTLRAHTRCMRRFSAEISPRAR